MIFSYGYGLARVNRESGTLTFYSLDGAGNVYGTTDQGGAYCVPYGCGVVYELSPPAGTKN